MMIIESDKLLGLFREHTHFITSPVKKFYPKNTSDNAMASRQ